MNQLFILQAAFQYPTVSITYGRDISFPIFIRKEIEKKIRTEVKTTNISFKRLIISFKRYNKSLNRHKIE